MITYRRAGKESLDWGAEHHGPRFLRPIDDEAVTIDLTIPAGGRGETELQISIYAESFDELAQLMVRTDPVRAIKAFGKVIENAAIRRR